ncbi:MAG: ABC transporter permease [Tepidiformaceae bacterium]
MGNFGAVIRMVGRRSLGHWRLLAMVATGVVLSSALMASVFLYSDAIRDLGLSHALKTATPVSRDIHVSTSNGKLQPDQYAYRRKTVDDLVKSYASDITTQVFHYGRTGGFYLSAPGQPVPESDERPRAHFQFQEDLAAHTRLVAGHAAVPAAPVAAGTPPKIEVLIGKASADVLGITIGQQFDIHSPFEVDKAPISVTVVGFVEPINANDEYWGGETDRFQVTNTTWPTYPFFVDEETLRSTIGGYLPSVDTTLDTVAFVDPSRIDSSNADAVEGRLRALDYQLTQKVEFARLNTVIPDTISKYRDKLFFTRLPLFALMLQIVGIVLFYVVMVASMVVERQTGEIALLKSRGASTWQILTVFAIEAAGICIAATLIGPLIAVAAISLLGLTPPFHDLSGGSLLHVPLSAGAVGLAALGALLAFLALLWPAYRACRYSITNYKQQISRPQTQPAFLRYYLDLVVYAVGALAFYQLRQHGGFSSTSLFGDKSADPVRLATPSLLILLTALVFLRLFPLTLRIVAWLTRRLSGATISIALTHMVRSPVQHSRLILLLILTTAVGVFAAGFRATLENGYQDRAAYEAGAEVRIEDVRKPYAQPLAQFNETIAKTTGSQNFTAVSRQDGSVNLDQFHSEDATVMGINPDEFASIADWRGDFAEKSLKQLTDDLKLSPPQLAAPPAIPADARFIGVWAFMPLNANAASLGMRVRNADGTTSEYRLNPEKGVTVGAWNFYSADLAKPSPIGTPIPNPVGRKFDSLFVRQQGTPPQVPEQHTALFDDIQTTTAATLATGWGASGFAEPTVIEPFDDITRYETIAGVSSVGSTGQLARSADGSGRTGNVARLSFIRGRGGVTTIGLRAQSDQRALPIVVDDGFLDVAQKKVGDEFLMYVNSQFVKVHIADSFKLFPTFDPSTSDHLFLADYGSLLAASTLAPSGQPGVFPNEAWLGDQGGTGMTVETLTAKGLSAETVADRTALLAQQASDPLIAASWQGILFLCFAAVLLLSALGFVTYSGLSAQARSLEFAVLRTMGMSGKQIIGVVSFEQCFVIAAGVIAGTVLGFPLSRLMIDSMGISEQGTTALPPLVSRIGWDAIITVYSLLGIVLATTIVALVLMYSRLAVSRALRMGEL